MTASDLSSQVNILAIQSFIAGTFRDILLVYLVTLSALTLLHYHILVLIIFTCIVTITFAYSMYILVVYGRLLRQVPGYRVVNLIFYYILTCLLFLLYCITLWFFTRKTSSAKPLLQLIT